MKEKRPLQIFISVILILIDIALFILLVKVFRWLFIDLVGCDICDYEALDEYVSGFRVYRFGAGCCEYLFLIIKTLVLIFLQKITYKKCNGSKRFFIVAIILHIILLLLCLVYVYKFLDGYNIFWLIRYFITGQEPPF